MSTSRDRPKPGGAMGPPGRRSRECGMKWRVVLELVGPDGTVGVHEVCGRAAVGEYAPRMIGLTPGGGQASARCIAGPSCSSSGGGSLPPPATLPALRSAAAPQGSALPAVGVVVRYGGGPRAAVYPMPMCGDLPSDPQPSRRDHARPMHARIRAGRREDGFLVALPPGPDAAVGVSAARRASGGGNDPAANHSCGRQAGARSRRGRRTPSRRWQRNRSRSPLTAAMCGRLVSIRGARSRSCSLRSATMTASRSSSPACRRRRLRNGTVARCAS